MTPSYLAEISPNELKEGSTLTPYETSHPYIRNCFDNAKDFHVFFDLYAAKCLPYLDDEDISRVKLYSLEPELDEATVEAAENGAAGATAVGSTVESQFNLAKKSVENAPHLKEMKIRKAMNTIEDQMNTILSK